MKYSKIKKISVERKECYDLTIENNHNFICNGHVIHNSGYRGEIGVLLHNASQNPFKISYGERIAQGVIQVVEQKEKIAFKKVQELPASKRGTDGFGSTGLV